MRHVLCLGILVCGWAIAEKQLPFVSTPPPAIATVLEYIVDPTPPDHKGPPPRPRVARFPRIVEFVRPKTKRYSDAQYGGPVAELLNLVPQPQSEGAGIGGLPHGTLHDLDGSKIPNKMGFPVNWVGTFVGDNKMVVIPKPPPMSLRGTVARFVPTYFRRGWFDNYISKNLRDSEPLELLEEATAFSFEASYVAHAAALGKSEEGDALPAAVEFIAYQLAVLRAMQEDERQAKYLERYPEFVEIVKANIRRTMDSYKEANHLDQWISDRTDGTKSGDSIFHLHEFMAALQGREYRITKTSKRVPRAFATAGKRFQAQTKAVKDAQGLRNTAYEVLGEDFAVKVMGMVPPAKPASTKTATGG